MLDDRPFFLSDVDGVVAGLMEGFSLWMHEVLDEHLPVSQISLHSEMGRSPGLQDLRARLPLRYPRFAETPEYPYTSIGHAFLEFMRLPNVYQEWVRAHEDAVRVLSHIQEGYKLIFVTATMKSAPENYASKFRWLAHYFPGAPVCSIPSELKQFFGTNHSMAMDDRWDICRRWIEMGVGAFCVRRPWSQVGEGGVAYSLDEIREFADTRLRLIKPPRPMFRGEFG